MSGSAGKTAISRSRTTSSWRSSLRELLVEKGIVTDEQVERRGRGDARRARRSAAREVVAKAWLDAEYKKRLLANGTAACEELGLEIPALQLVVVENTPQVHNAIVCTLCSCYPRVLLGIPPDWYKSRNYRSRMVREPRAVLAEFGLTIPGDGADPRARFHRRHALPRAADAAGGHRRLGRGAARRRSSRATP